MLEAEFKGPYNQFFKVFISNILEKKAEVLTTTELKSSPLKVPLSFIYKVPSVDNQSQIKIGDEIEVYMQLNNNFPTCPPNSNWNVGEEDLFCKLSMSTENFAWWPSFVQNIRGDYLVVRIIGIAGYKDVVERSLVRLITPTLGDEKSNISRKPLNNLSYYKREIDIPQELACCSKDLSVHKDLLRHCKSPATLYYNEALSKLTIFAFDNDVIRQVELLEETHLRMVRQKWTLMQSMNHASKRLQSTRVANNKNVYEVETFNIPPGCMGLAIGSKGVNIQLARQIDGIVSIDVNDETCGFTIYAKTKEAAKAARKILEFSEANMEVSQHLVARIIGKNGANIQSIVDKSGVIRVRIENNKPFELKSGINRNPSKSEPLKASKEIQKKNSYSYDKQEKSKLVSETRDLLSSQHEYLFNNIDKDFVNFVFIGTLESIENVKLLINFQMETLKDLDKIQAEKAEILRELHSVEYQNNKLAPAQPWSYLYYNCGPANFIRSGSPHIFLPGPSHQRLIHPIRFAPGSSPFFSGSCNNPPVFPGNSNRYTNRFSNSGNNRYESDFNNIPIDEYSLAPGGPPSGSNIRGKSIFKHPRENIENTMDPSTNRYKSNKLRTSYPTNSLKNENKKIFVSKGNTGIAKTG